MSRSQPSPTPHRPEGASRRAPRAAAAGIPENTPVTRPWLYHQLDRLGLRNYRLKIMAVAFLGMHVPLIALAVYFAVQPTLSWEETLWTGGVALGATLVGTAFTLLALRELLRPVSLVSQALRAYRSSRRIEPLPRNYDDEVGSLMSDARSLMTQLDRTVDALEHIDATTGLPNRRGALRLIAERVSRGEAFAVAVLCFENFVAIANALDLRHAERGAAILARRLGEAAEGGRAPGAALARVSPPSLALILPTEGAAGVEMAERVRRLARACGGEIDLGGTRVRTDLPAGIAFHPGDATEARALLDHAMAAVAQATPEAPVILHSPEARAAAQRRFRMEEELHRALAREEMELHYQPVVDLAQGRAVGAEALLRWRHPTQGLVSPGVFVPIAEATGLIDELGQWTLRRGCEQARDWADQGRDLVVAVNLSARQLIDPELHRRVEEAMRLADLRPDRLEVELTETAAMADPERSRAVLDGLRDLGVQVAIDDFGTGYASLSRLRALSFTKLKIDWEFVHRVEATPPSQAICAALIELCRGLGLRPLAEGVETEAEVRHLRARGCDLFQGNHFSRPVPAGDLLGAVDRIAGTLARARHDAS